jgi:hypothetical protein
MLARGCLQISAVTNIFDYHHHTLYIHPRHPPPPSAFRPSGGAPKGPHLATTLTSSSTTLAPTPRRQRLTTVGGWCDTITQSFPSRFSSRCFCSQAFLWPKNAWMAKFDILGQTQQCAHHKVGTTRPPKAIHTAIYAEGMCPYTHRASEQPTTVTLSVRGCLGGRVARGVQGSHAEGRPIRFVPSICVCLWFHRLGTKSMGGLLQAIRARLVAPAQLGVWSILNSSPVWTSSHAR